jgi:glycosyltransferase involved in cell wall biosynthesis
MKVAYVMSRFPKPTETFVLQEILEIEARGVEVEIFPLLRGPMRVVHPEARRLVERAQYQPFLSWSILFANLRLATRSPLAYFGVLWTVLRATSGSLNFFVGALGIFPKSVRFASEMERLGVTHIHAHFANHPAAAAFIISRLTGIPYSFTAHGSDLHVDRHMLREKIDAAAFAVTVSDYNKELMVDECGEDVRRKIQVIHCGVDPALFAPAEEKPPQRPFRILCVASFEEVKGHVYLVEACRLLERRGVDFECRLVGEGPQREKIAARVRQAGLSSRVRFEGVRTRDGVRQLLSEAHAVVLASVPTRNGKREGIPVALMEAMASGVPVVASRLSGIPELVETGREGILVAPRDSAALAQALESLSDDPELRRQMAAAGRAKVLREFDLAANAGRLLAAFAACQRVNMPTTLRGHASHMRFSFKRLLPVLLVLAAAAAWATAADGQTVVPFGVPRTPDDGIWVSHRELAALPSSGEAFQKVEDIADQPCAPVELSNQDGKGNTCILGKALLYAREGQTRHLLEVQAALRSIVEMPPYQGRALALARELPAYVIAADVVNLRVRDPMLHAAFREKIRTLLTTPTVGGPRNLIECHESRPNNWGTHCGAARAAVAAYLRDKEDMARVARIFKGWLGDRSSYAGFDFGGLSWQCNPNAPVGINPAGCIKEGRSVDGVLPDDQRRGGPFTWPPPHENYVYEALQGAVVQAVILRRAGYDAFEWESRALLRAFNWLYTEAQFPPKGDDTWLLPIINYYYGTNLHAPEEGRPGKNMGWTEWTHSPAARQLRPQRPAIPGRRQRR